MQACKLSFTMNNGDISYHDVIIYYSLLTNQVLDISKFRYCTDVINSSQTDIEILTATIDLLSILITGNQVVMPRIENLR